MLSLEMWILVTILAALLGLLVVSKFATRFVRK